MIFFALKFSDFNFVDEKKCLLSFLLKNLQFSDKYMIKNIEKTTFNSEKYWRFSGVFLGEYLIDKTCKIWGGGPIS